MSQIGLNTQQQVNLIANGPQAQGTGPQAVLPQELQNARPANAPQPRGGFSLMNIFRSIGAALGIVRPAAQQPQPQVVPQQPQPAPQTSPQKQLADLVYSSGELPADVKQMGKDIIEELRGMLGKEVIPLDKTITTLANSYDLARDRPRYAESTVNYAFTVGGVPRLAGFCAQLCGVARNVNNPLCYLVI